MGEKRLQATSAIKRTENDYTEYPKRILIESRYRLGKTGRNFGYPYSGRTQLVLSYMGC